MNFVEKSQMSSLFKIFGLAADGQNEVDTQLFIHFRIKNPKLAFSVRLNHNKYSSSSARKIKNHKKKNSTTQPKQYLATFP